MSSRRTIFNSRLRFVHPGVSHHSTRTDLAFEAHEALMKTEDHVPGVLIDTDRHDHATITRTIVENDVGATMIGKAIGTYVIIESEGMTGHDHDVELELSRLLAGELQSFMKRINLKDNDVVLVIGLGNWNATPDNVGPLTVSKLLVTRHLHQYQVLDEALLGKMRPVAALSPGVLGLTGMESAEIVRALVESIQPKAVVCVDALASTSVQRIGKTIQLTDAGINPGSGIGNVRAALTEKSLGVPVIVVGVPTVIYATTIVEEAVSLLESRKQPSFPAVDPSLLIKGSSQTPMTSPSPNGNEAFIREVLGDSMGTLVVTPKEIDVLVETISDVIADGLNEALHPGITAEEAQILR